MRNNLHHVITIHINKLQHAITTCLINSHNVLFTPSDKYMSY